jgi:hypothetical protein
VEEAQMSHWEFYALEMATFLGYDEGISVPEGCGS